MTTITINGRKFDGPFYLVGFGAGDWEIRSDNSGIIIVASRRYCIHYARTHNIPLTEK